MQNLRKQLSPEGVGFCTVNQMKLPLTKKNLIPFIKNKAITAILFFSISTALFANPKEDKSSKKKTYEPWFVGPLLAPTPINMKPGHPALEPALVLFDNYGIYSSNWSLKKEETIWAVQSFVDFQCGITKKLGVEILASFISNFRGGKSSSDFQDTIIYFGYQISNDIKNSWIPDCRCFVQEIFPTGRYRNLMPEKEGIDSTGVGSFQTGPAIAFRKLFYLPKNFLSLQWSIGYLFPSTVHVEGFNAYGGGFGTRGKVAPGQTFVTFFSGEYSFNQHWVFAFDTEFVFQQRSRFSGKRGFTSSGGVANVGLPPAVQISIAPEIEYNFSQSSGLIGGIWWTIAGKNSTAFATGFIAYSHIF